MKKVWSLLLCLGYIKMNVAAQPEPYADAWFMTGVSYKYSAATTLQAQLIYLSRREALAIYGQALIKKGKHIILNPGYLYLAPRATGTAEHTLINGVIFTAQIGKLLLNNRNVIWNRFRHKQDHLHFYRNRLRLAWPVLIGRSAGKLYIFDEGFYSFNLGKWNRNRWAMGYEHSVLAFLNLDMAFMRQKDNNGAVANLFLVMCTVKLARKM